MENPVMKKLPNGSINEKSAIDYPSDPLLPQDYDNHKPTISALFETFNIAPIPQEKPNVDYTKFDRISDISSSDDEALKTINEQLYKTI